MCFFSPQKNESFFLQCNLFKSPPIAGIETMLVGLHFSCSFQNYPCYWRDVSGSLSFFDLKSGASNANCAFLAPFLQLHSGPELAKLDKIISTHQILTCDMSI